jgi:hypothetical protein
MFSPLTLRLFCLCACAASLLSCTSTGGGGGNTAAEARRRAEIAAEPRGNYWVARRFRIPHTHFWGYMRRPGESWDKSRLVIVSERFCKIPDRLPEEPVSGPAYGYNHNYEYHFFGEFSGQKAFDPNSNMILPVFTLRSYKLVNENPGWLFKPNERFSGDRLLRAEIDAIPH